MLIQIRDHDGVVLTVREQRVDQGPGHLITNVAASPYPVRHDSDGAAYVQLALGAVSAKERRYWLGIL